MVADGRTVPRELRVLLCCCRLETGDAVDGEIRSLIDDDFDWDTLIQWAVWHEVAPLLHRTLDRVAPDRVPTAVRYALGVNHRGWVEHTGNLWSELRRVLDVLSRGGVPAIPFKGPVLGLSVYGELPLRPFRDLDFLIHARDTDRALTLLADAGYAIPEQGSPKKRRHDDLCAGQIRIPRHDAKVWIEPHWALAQHMFAIALDYDAIWARSTDCELDAYTVRTFAPCDDLLLLCIHGFRERWSRLKWLCDIAELLRGNPSIDWDALLREARAAGCLRVVILALVLAHDLLDAPVPEQIFARRDRRVEALVRQVGTRLVAKKPKGPSVWTPNGFHFFGRERVRDRVRYILRTVLLPRPALFDVIDLPDRLFWAYYPIRWVHDYLLLPPWLIWRQIIPGSPPSA